MNKVRHKIQMNSTRKAPNSELKAPRMATRSKERKMSKLICRMQSNNVRKAFKALDLEWRS